MAAHLRVLVEAEVPVSVIARVAGVPRSTVDHLLGTGRTVRATTAAALLAVTPDACTDHLPTVPAGPVRNHLLALMAADDLAAHQFRKHLRLDVKTFARLMDPTVATVKREVAEKVLAVRPGMLRSTRLHRIDATATRAHVAALSAANLTYAQIANKAGVHPDTVARIARGESNRIDADTAEWILGVPLTHVKVADLLVDAAEVREHLRRLRAVLPRRQVALLAAVSATHVKNIETGHTRQVTRSLADRILAVSAADQELVNPWGDPARVAAHLRALVRSGVPVAVIAENAGTDASTVSRLLHAKHEKVTATLADRILSVTPATLVLPESTLVLAVGSRRRVQALNCAGWPTPLLASRLGVSGLNLSGRKQVTKATADKIAALYEELRLLPGPSTRTATMALKKGLVPAIYWDEASIDDPDAVVAYPPGKPRRRRRRRKTSAPTTTDPAPASGQAPDTAPIPAPRTASTPAA